MIERLKMLIEPLSGVAVNQIPPRLQPGWRPRPEECFLRAAQQLGVLVGPEDDESLVHFVQLLFVAIPDGLLEPTIVDVSD
jgi:hypothetical protein